MLEKIRIILVNTSHPGNIGAAARAMKTMGLRQLVLVSPESFPHSEAIAMSSNAHDILDNARITSTLQEALEDCSLVIGTSARIRSISLSLLNPADCAEKLIHSIEGVKEGVALVFGREKTGLTNEELMLCHYHVNIPSNPEYSSLNLAAAVQILCYEIRKAFLEKTGHESSFAESAEEWAPINDIEQFYLHFEIVLRHLDFLRKENTVLMPKIRRMFNRIHLEKNEVNILRGILTAIQKRSSFDLPTKN